VNIPGITRGDSLAGVDREIALARALHAKVVRVELPWSELEPLGPNQIDPSALAVSDRLMSDAAAAGIGVIALVEGTPCWASSAPSSLLKACSPGGTNKAASWPPREPAAYAAFVAYLAQRYANGPRGDRNMERARPGQRSLLRGPEKPQRYAAILRAAYPAIKRVNPRVPVLAGSLVGSQRHFPSRALRRRDQGLLRRPVRALLQPRARLAARNP